MNEHWKFLKEVHSFDQLPADKLPEFIFWGRSNVGKSSLINLLTKKKIAKISRTPGRTRSLVLFEYTKIFRIIDLPGYGYSKISLKKVEKLDILLDRYLRERENLKKIFLLVDSRHLLKKIDKLILNLLDETTKKEVVIVFTKNDKIKSSQEVLKKKNQIDNIKKEFNKKIFNTSIKDSNGIVLLKKFLFNSLK